MEARAFAKEASLRAITMPGRSPAVDVSNSLFTIVHGYTMQTAHIVCDTVQLIEQARYASVGALARIALEHAARVQWLTDDPDTRLPQEIRLQRKDYEEDHRALVSARYEVEPLQPTGEKQRRPHIFEEIGAAGLHSLDYRRLHHHVHPSAYTIRRYMKSASASLRVTPDISTEELDQIEEALAASIATALSRYNLLLESSPFAEVLALAPQLPILKVMDPTDELLD